MKQDNKVKVLFVCMGNICRSPTADAVFKHQVKASGLDKHIYVDSAGTHAYHIDESPDERAQKAALKRGYNMQGLRARAVQLNDFEEFHYILAMDKNNLAILQDRCPQQYSHKLGLLMSYSSQWDRYQEVADPYYGGSHGFELVLDLVEDANQGLLRHIIEGSTEKRNQGR
ncbi:low molecular weight protein-tyrosine-phosphatase [Nitrosomonas communis]|uniref:protein-tyrosine-phosphatase n=1 Tax=Nitrosomonas communis TaxID=44574 RepID=A0A1H2Z080_9PROT|nr:low molecular weight protein-tyrosine-phosphatase [Nitrosomonas communis]SDX10830.1 protein-tyrosine phosphatase [Nitrosomonas communis]